MSSTSARLAGLAQQVVDLREVVRAVPGVESRMMTRLLWTVSRQGGIGTTIQVTSEISLPFVVREAVFEVGDYSTFSAQAVSYQDFGLYLSRNNSTASVAGDTPIVTFTTLSEPRWRCLSGIRTFHLNYYNASFSFLKLSITNPDTAQINAYGTVMIDLPR